MNRNGPAHIQISPQTDARMNELSREIGRAQKLIDDGTKDKNKAWDEIIEKFAEFAMEGKNARFIANDGYYLYKQPRAGTVTLNEQALKDAISEANWKRITVRKVDSELLESAVQLGLISAEIVDQCITKNPDTFSRERRTWTQDDKRMAQIYGIEVLPETEVSE